jgi:Ca2+-binding RTX toxin-like protein
MAAYRGWESLECRQLLAATIEANGNLLVEGTAKNDRIILYSLDSDNDAHVNVNGTIQSFPFNDFASIIVDTRSGDDVVQILCAKLTVEGYSPITVWCHAGNDLILGGPGPEKLFPGDGDDTANGGDGRDSIYGGPGPGNDFLRGGGGSDLIDGMDGADTIFGDAGNDHLYGGANPDRLRGGLGNDDLHGGGGDDILVGELGIDSLFGEKGNDRLYADHADADDDLSVGDSFFDTTATASGTDSGTTTGGSSGGSSGRLTVPNDNRPDDTTSFAVLQPAQQTTTTWLGQTLPHDGVMLVYTNGGASLDGRLIISGVGPRPVILDSSPTSIKVNGTAKSDRILIYNAPAGGIAVSVNGQTARYAGAPLHIDGRSGDDIISVELTGLYEELIPVSITGGAGNDTILTTATNDRIDAGEGDDVVRAGGGKNTVYGEAGNDSLAGGSGIDLLDGGDGIDTLAGIGGDDHLSNGEATS